MELIRSKNDALLLESADNICLNAMERKPAPFLYSDELFSLNVSHEQFQLREKCLYPPKVFNCEVEELPDALFENATKPLSWSRREEAWCQFDILSAYLLLVYIAPLNLVSSIRRTV